MSNMDTTASRIGDLHDEIKGLILNVAQKGAEIGKLLLVKKAECKRGQFTAWIEANCVFSVRQARKYIALAQIPSELLASGKPINDLVDGITGKIKSASPKPRKLDLDDARRIIKLHNLFMRPGFPAEGENAMNRIREIAHSYNMSVKDMVMTAFKFRGAMTGKDRKEALDTLNQSYGE